MKAATARRPACGCVEIGIKPSNGSAGRALGVRLIQRTTRRLALTAAGDSLLSSVGRWWLRGNGPERWYGRPGKPTGNAARQRAGIYGETWFGEFVSEFIARWPLAKVNCWQLIARWIWSLKALILRCYGFRRACGLDAAL